VRVPAERGADDARGLLGARERARPQVRRLAVVPAQPLAEPRGLRAAERREAATAVIGRLGVPDQEHLHDVPTILRPMKLYGTITSPFVRRVRIVAAEVGEPIERVDTATDEGQAELRAITPIRKVPVATIDGRTLFDSRAIIDWLVTTRGYGGLQPPRDAWHETNLVNAIDAALDSIIQLFYLRRDGIPIAGSSFEERQLGRTDAIFAWLGTQLAHDRCGFGPALGLAEISLVCALDWMDFRKSYPTERAKVVAGVRAAWQKRPSLAATRPE
jgi:glutathione S-transferase